MPAMDEPLEQRLVDLESRLAFQDAGLAELGEVVLRQGRELERLQRKLDAALNDLDRLRPLLHADAADEPPPPHY